MPIEVAGIPGAGTCPASRPRSRRSWAVAPGKPAVTAPSHERGLRRAGEQRRDAGPPGADCPLWGWLVPQHRAPLGCWLGAGHRERGRHPPRCLRGRAGHRPRGRRPTAGAARPSARRHCSSAATSAPRPPAEHAWEIPLSHSGRRDGGRHRDLPAGDGPAESARVLRVSRRGERLSAGPACSGCPRWPVSLADLATTAGAAGPWSRSALSCRSWMQGRWRLPSPGWGHPAGAQRAADVRGRWPARTARALLRDTARPAAAGARRRMGMGLGMSIRLRVNPSAGHARRRAASRDDLPGSVGLPDTGRSTGHAKAGRPNLP